MSEPTEPGTSHLSVRGAIVLGVGAMVGAGIFALLGEAAEFAGSAVWLSFVLAGAVAAALAYSMVKFAVRWPLSGGLVAYLRHGYKSPRVLGVTSWLGYLAAFLVVGAMVANSFGDYAADAFTGGDPGGWQSKAFAAALVVGGAVLSATGPKLIDRAQSVIVGLLLVVFTVFVVTTLPNADFSLMAPSTYPDASSIISSVALTFFAFLGFGVITFVTGDLREPRRQLPIAVYGALAITTVLYVAVALAVFGTLPVDEVIEAGPLALAQAAEPALGQAGYAMMTLAALLATASSVTAILYASVGLTRSLAESGTFPAGFGPSGRLGKHSGLIITATLMVIFVVTLSLEALASVGSAVSLAVFFMVAWAAFRLRRELNASTLITALAFLASGVVLVWFAIDLYVNQKRSFWAMIVLVALAFVVDELWSRRRRAAQIEPAG